MWKTIAVLIVEIIKALFEKFKKPPEQKQKEVDDEKVRDYLNACNADSDGFSVSSQNDKWGSSITETGARMESGQDNGVKR